MTRNDWRDPNEKQFEAPDSIRKRYLQNGSRFSTAPMASSVRSSKDG